MDGFEIRLATRDDAGAINDIYNFYVLTSTCTFQYEVDTLEDRLQWLDHHGDKHPVTVLVQDGEVRGWASLSVHREREGYRNTVETSIYIYHDHHGKGFGKALLSDLLARARDLGYHTVLGGMEGSQTASMKLHESFGFVKVAHYKDIGYKFDTWLDTVFMQLML